MGVRRSVSFHLTLLSLPPLLQFLVGDLGSGHSDMKLKVYKGKPLQERVHIGEVSLIAYKNHRRGK